MEAPNMTMVRDALAWFTNTKSPDSEPSKDVWVWFWEAIQGDFNEDRSTGQIVTDAGISMIPLVDQVCDARDLIANCKKLYADPKDTWAWVALALTLIGLFPTLGSLVKGVLKIFFAYVRRMGPDDIVKAVDAGMTLVVTFLRRRDVQEYLRIQKIDEVFKWLATEIRNVRAKISVAALTAAFDNAIKVLDGLAAKVRLVPILGNSVKNSLQQMRELRLLADKQLALALKPILDVVDTIILRLEREAILRNHGIVDVTNIHFRGALPESQAIALMRAKKPSWLSRKGDKEYTEALLNDYRKLVDIHSAKFDNLGNPIPIDRQYPYLSDRNIKSFHNLRMDRIIGPGRLYRILAPNSRGMSDCWVSKEVFEQLQNSKNPKEAWRRYLAVWPDWNVNGQFVIYDIRPGETLNVWRGITSSQKKPTLVDHHLEGGWEQVLFNIERGSAAADDVVYYKLKKGKETTLGKEMSQAEVDAKTINMSQKQKDQFFQDYLSIRKNINHPNISGPFETGWGYNEFDGQGLANRIGLPDFPGQISKLIKDP